MIILRRFKKTIFLLKINFNTIYSNYVLFSPNSSQILTYPNPYPFFLSFIRIQTDIHNNKIKTNKPEYDKTKKKNRRKTAKGKAQETYMDSVTSIFTHTKISEKHKTRSQNMCVEDL